MDVAVGMRRRSVLGQNVVVGEILGALGAVFQHGAHGRVAVDIGIFALDVLLDGRGVGQLLVNVHQIRFGITYLGMFGAVKDIGLGRPGIVVLDERILDDILDFLHMPEPLLIQLAADLFRHEEEIRRRHVLPSHGLVGLGNGVENLDGIKRHARSITLDDAGRHGISFFVLKKCGLPSALPKWQRPSLLSIGRNDKHLFLLSFPQKPWQPPHFGPSPDDPEKERWVSDEKNFFSLLKNTLTP